MGIGLRARRRSFVTEGIVAVTGTATKKWTEFGVPAGVTKLTAFLVGGGGGAGGGSAYANFGSSATTNWCNDAGGGGAGYVSTQEISINPLEEVTITIGSGGACGMPYSGDSDDGTRQNQTSGVGGGATKLIYNGTTYTANGGGVSYNTPTGRSMGASNGANGGSGGGAGGYYYENDSKPYEDTYDVSGGYAGTNGGSGGQSTYNPEQKHGTLYSGGSGAGVSTRPKGLASMQCATGGSTHGTRSALGYGDGGYSSWIISSPTYASNGAVFLYWNDGGI